MAEFLSIAFRKDISRRSLSVSFVVGTILIFINQGDALLKAGSLDLMKCLLTYAVPYCVATYGAVSAILKMERERR